MVIQKTKCLQYITCPVCGRKGLLQRLVRISRKKVKYYYRVTHYKGKVELLDNECKAVYNYQCYLPKSVYPKIYYTYGEGLK